MSRTELQAVLDFILNKANDGEFEVIKKACERRIRDRAVFASLGGEGPAAMAKRLSAELTQGVGATMESVRNSVKDFVAEIIRKNAPEISEEDLAKLLDDYVPPEAARKALRPETAATALPAEALLGMVRSFVEYSRGGMAPSRQNQLWQSNPRWQDDYWKAFPAEIKALVKAYLEGRIDEDTFGGAILSILGL